MKPMAALLSQLALGACSVVGIRDGTPEPAASVVDQVGVVQIRRYAPVLVAETTVQGGETAVRAEGFRRLAAYIFGRNVRHAPLAGGGVAARSASEKIAMTAPVAQSAASGGGGTWIIRFFLPEGMTQATAPRPLAPRSGRGALPSRPLAVRRFSGVATPAAVATQAARLDAALASERWRADGPLVTWFYDPPWTLPPFRRNEVARPVRPAAAADAAPG